MPKGKISEEVEEVSDFLMKEQKKCLVCQFEDVCRVKKYRFPRKKMEK